MTKKTKIILLTTKNFLFGAHMSLGKTSSPAASVWVVTHERIGKSTNIIEIAGCQETARRIARKWADRLLPTCHDTAHHYIDADGYEHWQITGAQEVMVSEQRVVD